MKVTTVSNTTRAEKADATIHGAVRNVAVPCFNNSPRLGVGGGSPKPKKSKAERAKEREARKKKETK